MEKLTFDKIPGAIELILQKLQDIEEILAIHKQEDEKHNEIMDVEEVARFLKFTKSTVYTKVSRGELPAFKSGKRLLFHKTELLEHIQLHKKMSSYQLKKEADLRIRHLPKVRKYTY
ncbi:MAG: DNA-binding protein [Pedobacter sp.]|nr:MAG: DNA-binding protein [Pedobacter sp.]